MAAEAALRKRVESTAMALEKAKNRWKANLDDESGRALLAAREEASAALRDLWAACPEEKPPTQHVT